VSKKAYSLNLERTSKLISSIYKRTNADKFITSISSQMKPYLKIGADLPKND